MPVLFENYNIESTVNFFNPEDVESKSTPGYFSIYSSVNFLNTTAEIIGIANFINYTHNLPATLDFIGNADCDLVCNIHFFDAIGTIPGSSNLPVTINFIGLQNNSSETIPAYVFFGNLNLNILAYLSFEVNSSTDFPSYLTINNDIAPDGNYIGNRDFTINIQIDNNYLGPIGILVQLKSVTTGNVVTTLTDATGYFEFINLTPGEYIVTPVNPSVTFAPNFATYYITNQNIQTNFVATGNLTGNNTLVASQTVDVFDYVNQNYGNPGTFAIEGFITLDNNAIYTNIITVITDETLASSFRQALVS